MDIATHILNVLPNPGSRDRLRISAKRYQTNPPRTSGYTLILLHAAATHKETFEPLIGSLFALSASAPAERGIREAWTIGEQSAVWIICAHMIAVTLNRLPESRRECSPQ